MRSGAVLFLLCCLLAACGSTPRRDLEFDRLHASLQALSTDPEFARLALAERALAEAAVRRLDASSINADEHAHLAYLAERRVDIAYIAAQTEQEGARLAELEREHASLQLAASRRENAAMREELERQRQRELVQQEVEQRGMGQGSPGLPAEASARTAPVTPAAGTALPPAVSVAAPPASVAALPPGSAATPGDAAATPPATVSAAPDPALPGAGVPVTQNASESAAAGSDQAIAAAAPPAAAVPDTAPAGVSAPLSDAGEIPLAGRLARLVPEAGAEGEQLTLEDLVFEPGTAQLVAEADVGIARVATFVNSQPARAIRIEGHTDATGSPDANRALSLRRAEAVRDALIARGVAAQRIEVSGEGSARPVASNDEADGRARNRRVVVVLRPGVG